MPSRSPKQLMFVAMVLCISVPQAFATSGTEQHTSSAVTSETPWDRIVWSVSSDADIEMQIDNASRTMASLFAADPEAGSLEVAYPGIIEAIITRLRPVMMELELSGRPEYRSKLLALYKENLSSSEAADIADFLESDPMKRFRRELISQMDMRTMLRDALANDTVSAGAVNSDLRTASLGAAVAIQGDDYTKIRLFYSSPTGVKFASLNEKKIQIDADWFNKSTPEEDVAITKAVIDAIVEHIALTSPRDAKKMRRALEKDLKP